MTDKKLPEIPHELYEMYPAMSAQNHAEHVYAYARSAISLHLESKPSEPAPIPMILHCPSCRMQHIDAPETHHLDLELDRAGMEGSYSASWNNPPHRSHLCHGCGTIWRPADVATVGVSKIETRGKADKIVPAERGEAMACNGLIADHIVSGLGKLGATVSKRDAENIRAVLSAMRPLYTDPPTERVRVPDVEVVKAAPYPLPPGYRIGSCDGVYWPLLADDYITASPQTRSGATVSAWKHAWGKQAEALANIRHFAMLSAAPSTSSQGMTDGDAEDARLFRAMFPDEAGRKLASETLAAALGKRADHG